ncbi:MAG TPA: SH3 domain-containing protein, partial [Phototrophicaceae bacterium]|nr:SH3 domain-containing protein [Phototrophicaceae bacterium]
MKRRLLLVSLAAAGLIVLFGMAFTPATAQVLVTNTPRFEPTVAVTSTPAPLPAMDAVVSVTVIFETANVRTEPSLDAEVVTQVSRGSNFPVIFQTGAGE